MVAEKEHLGCQGGGPAAEPLDKDCSQNKEEYRGAMAQGCFAQSPTSSDPSREGKRGVIQDLSPALILQVMSIFRGLKS